MALRLRLAYGAILALTVALVLPYTAAAAETPGSVDVAAARVAAEQQLISLGIDPGDAVFQVGARNYAGPDCPGSGWNCTSAATVVQIATGAAFTTTRNFDQCSLQDCTIVQTNVTGGKNEARCVQHTSASLETQSCMITQTNTTNTNKAFVSQSIEQSQPQGSQDAGQLATVNQANDTGANESAITQTIAQNQALDLSGAGTITQTQEAHQRADVCQGGAGPCFAPSNGKNVSDVAQSNVQRLAVHFDGSSSGTITQKQNTDPNNGQAIGARPKSTAVVSQRSVGSTNDSELRQINRQVASVHDGDENTNNENTNNENANNENANNENANKNNENANNDNKDEEISIPGAFSGTVVQQQGITGNPVCPAGGLCGYVAQDSTGVQRALERQDELQKVQGPPGATQSQFGPEYCCATQTGGNPENVNHITQVKVQLHTSSVIDGKIQGHCESSPTGCNVTQTLRQNATTQSNSCTGSPCNPTIVCHTRPTEGGGQSTVCTPGTATGPLPPPCPSPLCGGDAPIRKAMIAPLRFEESSANL